VEERSRRIIEAAIELAEKGGFEAVRLRDVAAHADVALGTLYRRFRSKEDLLLAALDLLVADHERLASVEPPAGDTPLARVVTFFETITEAICGRPNLARALVRSVASGAPGLTLKVSAFHTRVEDLITAALRGADSERAGKPPSDDERRLAYTLLLVWFASLTGWASGLHDPDGVIEHTRVAARLILRD
jgi:AcrR family transcriptional regulator